MRLRSRYAAVVLALAAVLAIGVALPNTAALARPRHTESPTPLQFIENVGQFASAARFQVRGGASTLFLTADAIWMTQAGVSAQGEALQSNLRIRFPGANPAAQIEPFGRLATHMSFFLGSDPRAWRSDVPVWGGVRYRDLYPGIDLELSGADGALALRALAQPGADLGVLRLEADGADWLAIGAGVLRIGTPLGELRLPLIHAPGVAATPTITQRSVAMPFAPASAATAEPAAASDLAYSTIYGTGSIDEGDGVAVDADGAAYIGGWSDSGSFPTEPGSFPSGADGINGVIVKQAPGSATPAYSLVIGGSSVEYISGIAVDDAGNAYVVGYTSSPDFPRVGGLSKTGSGVNKDFRDAFVVKINASGSNIVYSSYMGGSGDERGFEIAVDRLGAAYVTGRTTSGDFPGVKGGYDSTYRGGFDAYAAKISPSGNAIEYATYLGGSANDQGNDITVDASGAAYVTGYAASAFFPAIGGYDTTFNGVEDAFVVKLNSTGTSIVYGTFLGGTNADRGESIAVDAAGAAYLTGYTLSGDFGGMAGSLQDVKDAYALKLSPNGQALQYARYLGGDKEDTGNGIGVNASGEAIITGITLSDNFPLSANPLLDGPQGGLDGFVTKLNASGSAILYSTYLGGDAEDSLDGIALDASGRPYVTGYTQSKNYPVTTSASYTNKNDIVLSVLALGGAPRYSVSGAVSASGQGVGGVTIKAQGSPGTFTTTTLGDGSYLLPGLPEGTYTISAAKSGYTFTNPSRTVQVSANVESVNFAVASDVSTFRMSGQITLASGQPLAGVTVTNGQGGSTTTDADGTYSFSGLVAGAYTLTPSRSGYSFQPRNRSVNLSSTIAGQHFTAQPAITRVEHKAFAPLSRRVIVNPPPVTYCDAFEPNNNRINGQVSRIAIGDVVQAKLCTNEGPGTSGTFRQDNYILRNTQGLNVNVSLTNIPASLQGHIYLGVYDSGSLANPIPGCFASQIGASSLTLPCTFNKIGDMIVRVYNDDGFIDDANFYTLSVNYE